MRPPTERVRRRRRVADEAAVSLRTVERWLRDPSAVSGGFRRSIELAAERLQLSRAQDPTGAWELCEAK